MDIKKKNDLYLYMGFFFIFTTVIHIATIFLSNEFSIFYLIPDSILTITMFTLYKTKILKFELFLSVLLIGWALFVMFSFPQNTTAYSFVMSYSVMIIFRRVKINLKSMVIVISSLFTVYIISLIFNDISISILGLNLFLIIIFSLIHYFIYYNEYKELPDIKTKYNLTDQEILIIDKLFIKDPSNKRIATLLFASESTIKADLGSIYKKMGIVSGGSKKVELVAKLAHEGYLIK